MLNPQFPIVEGRYQMTGEWSIALPGQFNRRIENQDLVIWRPGFTIWLAIWNNDKNQTQRVRLNNIKSDISQKAFNLEESEDAGVLLFSYRLAEESEDKRVPALYGVVFGKSGHVQAAIYFDKESDAQVAKQILKDIHEQSAP